MAINSLSPAFVKINYTSSYAPHVMTLPCVPVIAPTALEPDWQFQLRGAALPVDVQGAVEAFVNVYKAIHHTTTAFSGYTLFTQATPESVPTPVFSGTLSASGSSTATAWRKAVQITSTWRADDFTIFKIVHLDAPQGTFDRQGVAGWAGAASQALHDYVTAPVSWLASRGGGRPQNFLQASSTLNEALRKAYLMT